MYILMKLKHAVQCQNSNVKANYETLKKEIGEITLKQQQPNNKNTRIIGKLHPRTLHIHTGMNRSSGASILAY